MNPAQAEALYEKVVELAHLTPTDTLLDAYCGVGTLALICAKSVKKVIGIECIHQAILDAEENAQRNRITNAHFICGMAEEKITSLEPIDVAILNPPRKGCELPLLNTLISQKVPRIVYVSCDPATLARDLEILTHAGYRVNHVQPFDMFPQTMHVECVVSLSLDSSLDILHNSFPCPLPLPKKKTFFIILFFSIDLYFSKSLGRSCKNTKLSANFHPPNLEG